MPSKLLARSAALLLALSACGGSEDVRNPLSDNDLSEAEVTAVGAAVQGSLGTAAAAAQAPAASPAEAPAPLAPVDRSSEASGNIVVNGQHPCAVAGRISWTGNVPWSANEQTGEWTIGGAVQYQLGDRTNNLNDCEVSKGVLLDGTLNLFFAGSSSTGGVGVSLNGTFSINGRGPTGGLVPRGSCFVNLTVQRGAKRATGSVCGRSVT